MESHGWDQLIPLVGTLFCESLVLEASTPELGKDRELCRKNGLNLLKGEWNGVWNVVKVLTRTISPEVYSA